ncbi:Metallo-hydrolase/oxidoreductase [Periconia macrospinosa]|uniref:Metallo-hydrolase/oxidoreductase n=1 Tax=Periconia macrospinosa TaxID=97972 RepID=A0A2V1DPJ3_9PLEO|nr:Metallo-hydrolase/oxidoreductase [Periconia macrospinosa]
MALSPLRADLFYTAPIPTGKNLPDGSIGYWQPTVVTLISGASEAVLVDTLHTVDQGIELGNWIEETLGEHKRLTKIYITHGHGDHFFNLPYLHDRFPEVEILSTQKVINHMKTQSEPDLRAFWEELFPKQIDEASYQVIAKPLEHNNTFQLEGHVLKAIEAGHSDTDDTTFLHIPSLDMVVAGDVVYNGVHMWMTESPQQSQRDDWIHALNELEALQPAIVVASHHRPGGVDGAFNIDASRQYIETFSRLASQLKNAQDLYDAMLLAFPTRIGKLVLWLSSQAAFASK